MSFELRTAPVAVGIAAFSLLGLLLAFGAAPANAQVHYHKDGRPWSDRAKKGPDAEVDGWYYNLGVTGLRVMLSEEHPEQLLIKHVFKKTPAIGRVQVGDWIVGANSQRFEVPHRNGYGMDKFGAHGPMADFARALDASMADGKGGKLELMIRREAKEATVKLRVGNRYGAFSPTFPEDCKRSDRILAELYAYLAAQQKPDGSWGSPPHDTFAPLAFLASGKRRYLPIVRKNVEYHARTTKAVDDSWLINWRYMAAAIVMSEYYLATGDKWVIPELQEVYDFLISTQYVDLSQVAEKTKKDRPEDLPRDPMDSHGGWGHNPGFEGYGPICMLTGQGALAFSLMKRCGIEVDRKRHDAAYAFLVRGTGPNGYTWYEDQIAGPKDWADMGRTGAAGLANWMSPYPEPRYREAAVAHARVIGKHPESFPDTHGSPVMGMAYAAAAAVHDPESFRRLMDSNRWWFTLAQCGGADRSFYYQPNRDNAGYGSDSRVSASAVTAFILSLPKRSLVLSGRARKGDPAKKK